MQQTLNLTGLIQSPGKSESWRQDWIKNPVSPRQRPSLSSHLLSWVHIIPTKRVKMGYWNTVEGGIVWIKWHKQKFRHRGAIFHMKKLKKVWDGAYKAGVGDKQAFWMKCWLERDEDFYFDLLFARNQWETEPGMHNVLGLWVADIWLDR